MKLKTLAFAALAAFAFGAGINVAPAEAAETCIACHNRCDANFEACIIAGGDSFVCYSRLESCRRRCGCQIP